MQCSICNNLIPTNANYCGKCGNRIEDKSSQFDYNKHVKRTAIFFFVLLSYVSLLNFAEFGGDYIKTLVIDLIFAIIILIFYFIDSNETNKLFKFEMPKWTIIIKILIGAPLFAILVSFLTDLLNQSIFDKSQAAYYEHFLDSPAPVILSIISIGLFPAIFEEIAFRGIILNELTKITGIKSSIIISSILFTILHLSLLSIFWIFPIGLIFGYLRTKYRTLWYGILGHFVYNSSIVVIEIITLANST